MKTVASSYVVFHNKDDFGVWFGVARAPTVGGMPKVINPIAARIRQLREEKGWSQEQLAEAADLSRDAVSRIERNDRKAPRFSTMKKIADALGIRPSVLLDSEPAPVRDSSPAEDRVRRIRMYLARVDDRVADAIVNAVGALVAGVPRRGAQVKARARSQLGSRSTK